MHNKRHHIYKYANLLEDGSGSIETEELTQMLRGLFTMAGKPWESEVSTVTEYLDNLVILSK